MFHIGHAPQGCLLCHPERQRRISGVLYPKFEIFRLRFAPLKMTCFYAVRRYAAPPGFRWGRTFFYPFRIRRMSSPAKGKCLNSPRMREAIWGL